MFLNNQEGSEAHSERNQRKIKELSIRNQRLNEEVNYFLQELNVSPEQLTQFINDKNQFSEENWEQVCRKKEELDLKLQIDLEQIQNPSKLKKTYQERKIQSHWLFVK